MGVELRSFGEGSTEFACDPALTSGSKVREMFREAGVQVACVATGVRFDAPVFPPVIGHLLPAQDACINEGRHMVTVAQSIGAPMIRVFGFEVSSRESRVSALNRICSRLSMVCDHARGRDVTVLIENGGAFSLASDLVEIIRRIASPQLAACYDPATAFMAGEDPAAAVGTLGRWLRVVRVRDLADGRPVRLGSGMVPLREFLLAVRACDEAWGTDPWAVHTWDRAWLPELSPAEEVLPAAAAKIIEWSGTQGIRHRPAAFQSAAPAMAV